MRYLAPSIFICILMIRCSPVDSDSNLPLAPDSLRTISEFRNWSLNILNENIFVDATDHLSDEFGKNNYGNSLQNDTLFMLRAVSKRFWSFLGDGLDEIYGRGELDVFTHKNFIEELNIFYEDVIKYGQDSILLKTIKKPRYDPFLVDDVMHKHLIIEELRSLVMINASLMMMKYVTAEYDSSMIPEGRNEFPKGDTLFIGSYSSEERRKENGD